MVKYIKILFVMVVVTAMSGAFFISFAGTAVMIKYGVVTDAQTVKKDAQHAGGALVGGLAAAVFARGPRHKPLKIAASAAAGAAIQGAATSGTLQQYTVKLIDGTLIKVSTEQVDIRVGDCVSVEQGQQTNIRRVGSINCEAKAPYTPPPHHQAVADDCQNAKDELAKAQTDDEVDVAVKKVRVLCGL